MNITEYLTEENHYGDGQYYFNCVNCDQQHCVRGGDEEINCKCGCNIKVVFED